MLEAAVIGEHGTGARAAVPGYSVAGKTGTARKPNEGARGYSGEYIATFVGFAPVDDPQLVVAVMVDEPRPFYGGIVAAPVFSEVMQAALTARRVVPDGGSRSLEDALLEARAVRDRTRRGPGGARDPGGRPGLPARRDAGGRGRHVRPRPD
jgi:cell division protein FtsI (penicillin-binding protein 3)